MSYRDDVLATTGLVGYWPLNEASGTTATDVKAGRNGTTTGATPGATGIVTNTGSTAYSWDANSEIVSMGENAAFKTADFSIELWFTQTGTWAGGRALAAHRLTADGQGGWVIMGDTTANRYTFFVHRDPDSWLGFNTDNWLPDTVYHAVFAFDGAKQYVYRNGALVSEQSVGQELTQPSGLILSIGAAHAVAASSHRGSIADVALYSVALDANTVAAHYAAGIAAPSSGVSRIATQFQLRPY